jgi:hypothetical protein
LPPFHFAAENKQASFILVVEKSIPNENIKDEFIGSRSSARVGMVIDERRIPVRESVQDACEILGFDPLYVANEGMLPAIVGHEDAASVLQRMR